MIVMMLRLAEKFNTISDSFRILVMMGFFPQSLGKNNPYKGNNATGTRFFFFVMEKLTFSMTFKQESQTTGRRV